MLDKRSIAIIQIQNINLKLNMKDVNKILAKAHFKCKKWRKQHIFKETCLYGSVGSLPLMPSLLPCSHKADNLAG